MNNLRVAIIGGGLSGLYTARLLTQMNVAFVLFEARERLGGRILSTPGNGPAHDLGPAWWWPDFQPRMAALISALGLIVFPQYSDGATLLEKSPHETAKRVRGYASGNLSMRIQGGVSQLTQALAAQIAPERVVLNARISGMRLSDSGITLHTDAGQGVSEQSFTHVISAVPLRLLAQDIHFEPRRSPTIIQRWSGTPTWMAPHAKYVAVYDRPFWHDEGLSGTAQSHVGPMVEIHDASDASASAALFGFVGIPATERLAMGEAALLEQCHLQLVRLFGGQAATPVAHYIKDWAADRLTASPADLETRQRHFATGYSRPDQDAWSKRLLVSGTEASIEHNGYMEGALDAAESAVERLRIFVDQ